MERTDETLVVAHRQGDGAAFAELVRRYADRLLRFLMRMTGNREQAEDLFQETFRRVHEKAHQFQPDEGKKTFKPWLYTIATRLTLNHRRKQSRRINAASLDPTDPPSKPNGNPHQSAVRAELKTQVRSAVDSLPPRQRTTLQLAYYEGLSYPEVARVMECSLGTVKTQMYRALHTLADRLPEEYGGEL